MDKDHPNEESCEQEKIEIPPIALLREELAREEAKYAFQKTLWNIAAALVVAAAITALMATRLFILIRVNGNSMYPTLSDGEIIILRQTKQIETGDVIGFYYGGRVLLKRVIAGGCYEIEIDANGNVFVNGEKRKEDYLGEMSMGKCELEFPYSVPEGMVFVLGDNRAISVDSRIRSIGCVEEEQIVGRAVFRAWPAKRMGVLR